MLAFIIAAAAAVDMGAPASPLVMDIDEAPEASAWPVACHLHLTKHGDVRIVGTDTTSCIAKLEEAVRLARAAKKVNDGVRRKRGAP